MRIPSSGSYVCWRCLSRGHPSRVYPSRVVEPARIGFFDITSHRISRRAFATVQQTTQTVSNDGIVSDIRLRLRQWEAENGVAMPTGTPVDDGEPSKTRNLLTRPRNQFELAVEDQDNGLDQDQCQPLSDGDGFLELLPQPSEFKAGDLVAAQEYGDRMSLLAICLGSLNGFYHFYTATGSWVPTRRMASRFVIRSFVGEEDLQPVIEKLPKETLPWETLKEMQSLKMGPDRATGAGLLRAMSTFQQDTEAVMQKFGTRLENAHRILAKSQDRYLTLHQIASRLMERLPQYLPPSALFAVHHTIMMDDVGFRPLEGLGAAGEVIYEVTPQEDVTLINNMQTLVRLFTDLPGKLNTPLSDLTSSQLSKSQLGFFILKAREAIDRSRRYRSWTPHGTLSPARKPRRTDSAKWTDVDLSVLHFMHLWVGYDQFSSSSPLHWIGSTILRATGKYKDSEYLSTSTGWTFLQEVGYITPWDIHARHAQRIPGVPISRETGFQRIQLGSDGISAHLTSDIFTGKRKEWKGHRVFAIDAKKTVDIDDAVSIETTGSPGEHWIHVHVADPASQVRPGSLLAERAKLVPLNLYLSGHHSNIWGLGDEMQKLFSLGPGKPCLTFSGRVNEKGELLDYKITPGKLDDFVYMTPDEVNLAVNFEEPRRPPPWATVQSFRVGESPAEKPENRKMTSASELQPDDLESLNTLQRLSTAISKRRLANGSMPFFPLRPRADASFDHTSTTEVQSGLMICNGDPSISISWDDGAEAPLVTNTMVLAGEIAARWCTDRNIPIPFVKQPMAQKNMDFLKAYVERVYYPLLSRGEQPSQEQFSQFMDLVGRDEISTQPGPYFLMGVDSYAKVTSPLRRYSDLLAHWQIENALVQEMETGKVVEDKLPLSRKELDDQILPWMQLRQYIIKRLGNAEGNAGYMNQALLRAWKYPSKNDSRLPDTFRITVKHTAKALSKGILGWLDWFGLKAWLVPDGLGRLGVKVADIREGDVFEVRLKDINVHEGDVFVEAVDKIRVKQPAQ